MGRSDEVGGCADCGGDLLGGAPQPSLTEGADPCGWLT